VQQRKAIWVGWSGATEATAAPELYEGLRLKSVEITQEEYEAFYLGFANATLWPLYHDAVRTPSFHREWWHAYTEVNRRFAEAIDAVAAPGATVWVHDYQLQLVPHLLRERRPDLLIGFFLHIPFPPRELFLQLPWRREIIAGLLGADLVGFQSRGAASNFMRLAQSMGGSRAGRNMIATGSRLVQVEAFPISVDTRMLGQLANSPEMRDAARRVREQLGDPELVLLGVDRLDYTKGIEQRVRAVAELYEEGVLEPSRHVMVQVAVPSRDEDSHYRSERRHLEQIIGQVNGEYSDVGRPAIHYLHRSLPLEELVALYLAADVMIVTPFRDGMNLVAKEYVACRTTHTGALVLSEFAGAAAELRSAYLVNPHDLEGIKEGIRQAMRANLDEQRLRMSRLRRTVQRHDVNAWSTHFLAALEASRVMGQHYSSSSTNWATDSTILVGENG
jgi:trehalose 6-phosphate synthase